MDQQDGKIHPIKKLIKQEISGQQFQVNSFQFAENLAYWQWFNVNQRFLTAKTQSTVHQKILSCKCGKNQCKTGYCPCNKANQACLPSTCKCRDCHNKEVKVGGIVKQPKQYCECRSKGCLSNYCDCHKNNQLCQQQCKCMECGNIAQVKVEEQIIG